MLLPYPLDKRANETKTFSVGFGAPALLYAGVACAGAYSIKRWRRLSTAMLPLYSIVDEREMPLEEPTESTFETAMVFRDVAWVDLDGELCLRFTPTTIPWNMQFCTITGALYTSMPSPTASCWNGTSPIGSFYRQIENALDPFIRDRARFPPYALVPREIDVFQPRQFAVFIHLIECVKRIGVR